MVIPTERKVQIRTTAPLHHREPVKVVLASDQDASWAPLFGGFPGTTSWEKTLWQTQESLKRLHISSGLGNTLGSPRGIWKALLGKVLLEHPTKPAATATLPPGKLMKMDLWITLKVKSCLLASRFTFNDPNPLTLISLFPRIPSVLNVLAYLFAVSYRRTDIVIWQAYDSRWEITEYWQTSVKQSSN